MAEDCLMGTAESASPQQPNADGVMSNDDHWTSRKAVDALDVPVALDAGELSNRACNALVRSGIFVLNQAAAMTKKELLLMPGIGKKGLALIERSLLQRGIRLDPGTRQSAFRRFHERNKDE